MSWHLEIPDEAVVEEIDSTLKAWEGTFGTASGFASGDLGWSLRNGWKPTAEKLRIFASSKSDIGAIGFVESPTALWLTIDPSRLMDTALANAIADESLRSGFSELSTNSTPALVRRELGARGYSVDPSPWDHLWKPLTDADIVDIPGVVSTSTEALIEQRILAQRSAFENSTFTREKWDAMAAGPSFAPPLDLVALDDEGRGVSALTAWLPGPEACGMIEPMGTHAEHQRQGHGLRVLRASFSEMRKLGASGVRVFTTRGNDPAVATYKAAGFRVINLDTTMVRDLP